MGLHWSARTPGAWRAGGSFPHLSVQELPAAEVTATVVMSAQLAHGMPHRTLENVKQLVSFGRPALPVYTYAGVSLPHFSVQRFLAAEATAATAMSARLLARLRP